MREQPKPRTKIWFDDNGNLMTNNPSAFAKEFDLPVSASVDGLRRVSFTARELNRLTGRKGVDHER